MNVLRSSTLLRNLAATAIFLVIGFLAVYSVDEYTAGTVAKLALYICAALGLTVLVGGNGQISLGHAALMAIGAYTMAKFLPSRTDDFGQVSIGVIVVGLILAIAVTTLVGAVIGVAAARLRGPYLAGATLALGVAVPGVTTYFHDTFNGEQGLPIPVPRLPASLESAGWTIGHVVALIAIACAAVALLLMANLKRSAVGRHLAAVRDHEISAQLCGLSVPREQVRAFAFSAATAGVGGGLLGLVIQGANPHSFGLVLSLSVLGAVVIGGLGSLRGAIWGSIVVVYLDLILKDELKVDPNAPAAAYGLLLIVVMLAMPGGIQGLLTRLGGRLPRRSAQPQGGN
ncbi:branched-chain amino acid ABC transporter permease [Nocardioides albidus]|uniref:Branched-chain amino acid ABC transporter permease n=1 Tax=Nocardioides albidus TaxID=1517589 RepID=A0A5C4VL46_9ACTN|nr:branched-chain amino acid ABC transporter permease [Nocardioides albidus]TNM36497.1 branched-chain amino acid ABC transporter permease [Nocardioides albidus]